MQKVVGSSPIIRLLLTSVGRTVRAVRLAATDKRIPRPLRSRWRRLDSCRSPVRWTRPCSCSSRSRSACSTVGRSGKPGNRPAKTHPPRGHAAAGGAEVKSLRGRPRGSIRRYGVDFVAATHFANALCPGAVLGREAGGVGLPSDLARLRGADHGFHLVVHRVRGSFRDALAEGVRGSALAMRRVAAVELVERLPAMAGREAQVSLLLLAGRRRVRDRRAFRCSRSS